MKGKSHKTTGKGAATKPKGPGKPLGKTVGKGASTKPCGSRSGGGKSRKY